MLFYAPYSLWEKAGVVLCSLSLREKAGVILCALSLREKAGIVLCSFSTPGEGWYCFMLLLPLGEGWDEGRSEKRMMDLNSSPTLIASDGHSAHLGKATASCYRPLTTSM